MIGKMYLKIDSYRNHNKISIFLKSKHTISYYHNGQNKTCTYTKNAKIFTDGY